MWSRELGKMRKNENNTGTQNTNKNLNNERFAYVMTCLVGNEVTVHMKDGNEVKGLFHAYNCNNKSDKGDKNERGGGGGEKNDKGEKIEKHEIDISLTYGRVLPKNDKVSGPINKAMIIPENNYKAIIGKDIKLDLKDPDEVKLRKEKFKIDTDISEKKRKENTVNRELKRWMCDDDTFDEKTFKLENSNEPWDQFEQNRKLYGVTTTYKEEIYTTNLDINKVPHYVKMHADKIAKELEKRGMHLDPEDAEKDNKNLDEEDLFGAVRTSVKEKYNKNQKYKKEENKPKTYQGKFHPLVIKDLKEKIQSVKRENEKKYPNKQKPESCDPSSSNDDTNSIANRKTKLPTTPKRTNKITDFIGINALNLEPALPKLDDKIRSEWVMFKNKVKNKTSNKKDKTAEKQEFITAAKEFNERLANKMSFSKKEAPPRSGKEYATITQSTPNNQKNVSNFSGDKPKHTSTGSVDNKITNNNSFNNVNNVNYNANNMMMNNPNIRPHDFYMYNCNNISNMKNSMFPHNIDLYSNIPLMPDTQNPMYHYGDHHMYRGDGMVPVYSHGSISGFKPNFPTNLPFFSQNMKMGDTVGNEAHSSSSTVIKENSNDELIPFPLKIHENKTSFSDFVAGVLNYSKGENCVECEIGFKSSYQFSYKNVLGEIPACAPLNYFPSPPATFPINSTSVSPPTVPNNNIPSIPMNFPFIPIIPPNINNPNPYIENHSQVYFNPYFPNFYPNNNTNANTSDNNNNMNANSNNTNNLPSVNSSNIPYVCNMPGSAIDNSYSSNKNMSMYPVRNPIPYLHANHINFPLPSCVAPNMNYPLNNNTINMANNPNIPNSNMSIPPYPSELVLMNPPKFASANPNVNPSHNQNPNPSVNLNSQVPAPHHSLHPQFMPPYRYQNYYNPSHGVN